VSRAGDPSTVLVTMMIHRGGPRLVELPASQREALAEMIRARGVAATSRFAGLGKVALLAAVARGQTTPGGAALLREAFDHAGAPSPSSSAGGGR
jgi:hypothetical protein